MKVVIDNKGTKLYITKPDALILEKTGKLFAASATYFTIIGNEEVVEEIRSYQDLIERIMDHAVNVEVPESGECSEGELEEEADDVHDMPSDAIPE